MQTLPNTTQLSHFAAYLNAFDLEYVNTLIVQIHQLGLHLTPRAQLKYSDNFTPLHLSYDLIYVRHGETYGNCGQATQDGKIDPLLVSNNIKDTSKRIFQGAVDEAINQLTAEGKNQAVNSAKKLEKLAQQGWQADLIFHSPLRRARDTAIPFIERNDFYDRFECLDECREISFGSWDNRRVCDFAADNHCHEFYKNQNVLVKKSGINGNQIFQHAECFAETLLRAKKMLLNLNATCHNKKVIIFSHSMFGAACSILLGKGSLIEDGDYLAFDGKRSDRESYCMPHATPYMLNAR